MSFTRSIIIGSIGVLFIVINIVHGAAANLSPKPAKQQITQDTVSNEKVIMDNFYTLFQKRDDALPALIRYIDENIASVSKPEATAMVIELEKVQKENLLNLQEEFEDNELLQKALSSQHINGIENKETKALLAETLSSGFKIETAEGVYFPVIDYSAYKKYRSAVTPDIAAYIDIMSIESDKTPSKDAALMISWSEVLKRAIIQEQFISHYSNSAKVEDVRQLLKHYTIFALYGTNNTPLFSYDTKQMVPEAKETYLAASLDTAHGSFSKIIKEYLTVLKRNDYQLTSEVQEHRNKIVGEFY